MKGLILKDLYMTKSYCRSVLGIAVLFLALSALGDGNQFFMMYPCILAAILPVTLLAYDEREHWELYSGTLPYTRAQQVSAKYIVGLTVQMGILLLTLAVQGAKMAVQGVFRWGELGVLAATLLMLSCFSSGVLLPFTFRFGVEKGRLAYYGVLALTAAAGMVLLQADLPLTEIGTTAWPMLLLLAAMLALYALSWLLSVRWYSRREF